MYYYVDENGLLQETTHPDDSMPYFDVYQDYGVLTGSSNSVSSGDVYVFNYTYPTVSSNSMSYDDYISAIADHPAYAIYPAEAAVRVFSDVIKGEPNHVFYVVLSGGQSSDAYLYYSDDFLLQGNTITLLDSVTVCRYYRYRYNGTSSYEYRYEVSSTSNVSFNLSNQLAYTNCVSGYPVLEDYKSRDSYSMLWIILVVLLILLYCIRRKK